MLDGPEPKKIVLVAMADSIHVARWVSQFPETDYLFSIFPSTPNRRVHPLLKNKRNVSVFGFEGLLSIPLWGIDLVMRNRVRSALLRRYILANRPDHVHALEFQHGAYLAEMALRKLPQEINFIATNYGSDIFWFQQFPSHLKNIKRVLKRANSYSAECSRDVGLAQSLGFKGRVLPVIPNAGGLVPPLGFVRDVSERKTIAIKGYDNWVGRAVTALKALPQIADQLVGLKIVVYSCNRKTLRYVKHLKRKTSLDISAFPKHALSHDEMLELFGESLIYIGVSLSDGISTSMSEALAMGAFPIQTNTACTSEWFVNGHTGISIEEVSSREITQAIKNALANPLLRDAHSKELSMRDARERLNTEAIRSKAFQFYEKVQ